MKYLLLVFFFLFLTVNVFAQVQPNPETNSKAVVDILKQFFPSEGEKVDNTKDIEGLLSPTPDPLKTPKNTGRTGFTFYCQGAAQWQQSCSGIGGGGCGPTSLAMIMTTLGVQSTPSEVDTVFRSNGWRGTACSDAGSNIYSVIASDWLRDTMGFRVGTDLVQGTSLDLKQAKSFIDNGYLLLASSDFYPLVNSKIPGAKRSHIFVVDDVNIENGSVSIRDPNNCMYGGGDNELEENRIRSASNIIWKYAFPITNSKTL